MSRPIYFAPLGSADARRIHGLQHRLFPRVLRESVEEIRSILRNTEKHMVCNLSFGLFDNTRLVGYLFGYVETRSIFYQREDEVVYLKEIALLPGYQHYLLPMFSKLYDQWSAFTPGLPLEAHAEADALRNWQRLARLFRHLGMRISSREEARSPGRPPYQLLRLDVSDRTAALALRQTPLPNDRWAFRDGISVTTISDARQWATLEQTWGALLAKTPDSNVFQSFEYLWEWWKHLGVWNELRIIVIRRQDEVIGLVPLMLDRFPIFGRVVGKLMFITSPMEMSRPKFIFGDASDICLPALLAYLTRGPCEWDILDVDEQLEGAEADAVRRHFTVAGCLLAESETVCPYIELAGSWDEFLRRLSRRMRSNINRLRKKLAEKGKVTVRCVREWPALRESLDVYCSIEEKSWKAARHLTLSSDKALYYFHRGLARAFGRDGKFEMRVLECDGKPLAATYGIVRDDVFQSLKIAHDAAYDDLSPGTLLESYELEDLFKSDLRCYELMGSFLANKLRWTSTVYDTVNLHIYRRKWRLVLFYFIFFVFKRRVKSILKRTGQFERVDRLLNRLGKNPFPRY